MSFQWYFYSFAVDAFHQLCGSADRSLESALVHVVTDEEAGFEEDELELAERLARQIAREGLSYGGKSKQERRVLDHIIEMMFNRYGLAEELGVKPVLPEGVNPRLIKELVECGGSLTPLEILPRLVAGQRFGESEPADCNYTILMPAEVNRLKTEVDALLALPNVQWTFKEIPDVTRSGLLPAIDACAGDPTRGLFAHCG